MCLEVVKEFAGSKETHALMMKPMADVIGGYLQAFGVPITNQEYYEGNVTYSIASQVNELKRAIMKMLTTDGGGWTEPIHVLPSSSIEPFHVPPTTPVENHCGDLISTIDLRHGSNGEREIKRSSAKIPLPFLENNQAPKAIAVPFKSKTLYSLFEKDSFDILLKYYTAATHCYSVNCAKITQLTPEQQEFDRSFHHWLVKDVLPHLHDGVWYPAFSGVYQILETMSSQGLQFPKSEDIVGHSTRIISHNGRHFPLSATSWFFVACIIGFLLIFWFIVLVLFLTRKKHGRRCHMVEDYVISYNCDCSSIHSEELVKALVGTLCDDKDSGATDSINDSASSCKSENPIDLTAETQQSTEPFTADHSYNYFAPPFHNTAT